MDTSALLSAATELDVAYAHLELPLDLPGVAEARASASGARQQLADYVIPRLRDVDAPVLAVVGGSTGAGKSTVVNSLVGDEVTRPGVLRPTTRSPVLVHHPSSARWFEGTRILGGLARVRGGPTVGTGQLELVAHAAMPAAIALLDAPDVDSVVDANRDLAAQLLAAADLWIFVTTASRYADAVPWTFLRSAVSRGVHVGIVLNRVPPDAVADVRSHLSEMLHTESLGSSPLFTIAEQPLDGGLLPPHAVVAIRTWLDDLASDQQARAEMIGRSLRGTLGELAGGAERLAAALDAQREFVGWLAGRVDDAFVRAESLIADDVRDGTVMRGEVLARWQDLVGTGELLKELQSTIGRWRDRVVTALTGRPKPIEHFQGAVSHGVALIVAERAAQAVDEVAAHWRAQPAGRALLERSAHQGVELSRPTSDLHERTARMVRDWQGAVIDLLREQGAVKRRTARALSYGVNGLAAVLMVGVFAQTGGLTGAEIAIAGGGSAVGQKLLEAVLGDQAVRTLTTTAREELDRRIRQDVLAVEAERFNRVLHAHHPDDDGSRLRDVAARVRQGLRS